jgi:hypothetical protein
MSTGVTVRKRCWLRPVFIEETQVIRKVVLLIGVDLSETALKLSPGALVSPGTNPEEGVNRLRDRSLRRCRGGSRIYRIQVQRLIEDKLADGGLPKAVPGLTAWQDRSHLLRNDLNLTGK